jgi:hypothetical protein
MKNDKEDDGTTDDEDDVKRARGELFAVSAKATAKTTGGRRGYQDGRVRRETNGDARRGAKNGDTERTDDDDDDDDDFDYESTDD